MSSVFPAESAVGTANFAESEVESIRIKLAASGPIPTAVLYNNAKDLVKALVVLGTLGLVPTGTISAFAGTTLPSGYLWCDGAAQLKASYPDLYLVLGASRYAADTATQFYTPNLTSHLPRGAATTSGVVTTNNINTHTHSQNATNVGGSGTHSHTIAANTNSDGAHNHSLGGPSSTNSFRFPAAGTLITVASSSHGHATNSDGAHNHGISASTNSNGDHTHNAVMGSILDQTYIPAFVEVNFIIKT